MLCARRRAPSLAGLRVGVGGAGRLHHRARIIERRFDSRLSPQGFSRIEMRSIAQAQGALKELARLLPDAAARIVAGEPLIPEIRCVPFLGSALEPGVLYRASRRLSSGTWNHGLDSHWNFL